MSEIRDGKSLSQIWNDTKCPFFATEINRGNTFYCVGVSPVGIAVGWDRDGMVKNWDGHIPIWVKDE